MLANMFFLSELGITKIPTKSTKEKEKEREKEREAATYYKIVALDTLVD
jgi:hypothetical protein